MRSVFQIIIMLCMNDVTRILRSIENGDPADAEKLLPMVYQELRKLAAAKLSKENAVQSIQPTVLVHEAFVRLVDKSQHQLWNGRGHFFAAAAVAMRRILVERARRRKSQSRANLTASVDIEGIAEAAPNESLDILALDEALIRFEKKWPERAKLVKLRYFAGLTIEEAARTMNISVATAGRHWTFAKSWLYVELQKSQ